MLGKTDKTLVPLYAEPAFYKSPPASSLPIPKFSKRLWSGSGVRLTPGTRDSLLDTVTHVQPAPSNSEGFHTKSEPVSVTSETRSPDAKTAISAAKEHDKPIDMKPEATLTAPVQQIAASDDLKKQLREANERLRHRLSENKKLRRRQKAIIKRIESQTTNTTPQYAPQARVEPQEQGSAIPANIQHAALQMCMNQLIQATEQRAVEALEEYKRSTDHLLQVTIQMLERNLAKQREIQQEESFVDEGNTPDEQLQREQRS